jgi:dihydrofolate reductase/thymidylate synthase
MSSSAPSLAVVLAVDQTGAIGRRGRLPWGDRLAAGRAHFARVTTCAPPGMRNAVIMGRRTCESLGPSPLPSRVNVVLTRQKGWRPRWQPREADDTDEHATVLVAPSLDAALERLSRHATPIHTAYVIGGAELYEEALAAPECRCVYRTRVEHAFADCDVRVRAVANDEELARRGFRAAGRPLLAGVDTGADAKEPALRWRAELFVRGTDRPEEDGATAEDVEAHAPPAGARDDNGVLRVASAPPSAPPPHDEEQYLALVRRVLAHGRARADRTGVGTRSVFGAMMRFDLRDHTMPLLTTKRVFWRGVVEELLWFLRGCTDARELSARGVRIWDANGSRAHLDRAGLRDREEGDLGPIYGFQWRHFGAAYRGCRADHAGEGVDQLRRVVELIRTEPTSRRILMSAWNPAALDQMALPPCHVLCQFYVDVERGTLSCLMYQRSADVGLGVPFNVASYALLTHLLAHVCGLRAGELVHALGDVHAYANHLEPLRAQLERAPRRFPRVRIAAAARDLEAVRAEDVRLEGYDPHPPIRMGMAV